ncbi:MAG: hypothetical protein KAG53_12145 [Endozoicomonadaceae bacterium]|nr:hypothetical protein [Endozoicomonadaceae bacterium]
MNFLETASYNWNLNESKWVASRVLLTVSAIVSNLLYRYSINIKEVDSIIRKNPEFRQCYFYKSLKKRGIKIDLFTPTPKLIIPQEYEKYKRVAIDGAYCSRKNELINGLMGKNNSDVDATLVDNHGNVNGTKFYAFYNNVALCEMPRLSRYVEGQIREYERYDDYDSVVIIIRASCLAEDDVQLIKIAENAGKPYIIIKSNMCSEIVDRRKHITNKMDHLPSDSDIKDMVFNEFSNDLKTCGVTHINEKFFMVDSSDTNIFDFKKVSDLIKSQNFNNTSDNQI